MMSKQDPTTQKQRFEQTARELGVDLDEDRLRGALRSIAHSPQPLPRDAWLAVKWPDGHIELSTQKNHGYRHWVTASESDLPDGLAVTDYRECGLIDIVDVPPAEKG